MSLWTKITSHKKTLEILVCIHQAPPYQPLPPNYGSQIINIVQNRFHWQGPERVQWEWQTCHSSDTSSRAIRHLQDNLSVMWCQSHLMRGKKIHCPNPTPNLGIQTQIPASHTQTCCPCRHHKSHLKICNKSNNTAAEARKICIVALYFLMCIAKCTLPKVKIRARPQQERYSSGLETLNFGATTAYYRNNIHYTYFVKLTHPQWISPIRKIGDGVISLTKKLSLTSNPAPSRPWKNRSTTS